MKKLLFRLQGWGKKLKVQFDLFGIIRYILYFILVWKKKISIWTKGENNE